jgi:hypothetical protein
MAIEEVYSIPGISFYLEPGQEKEFIAVCPDGELIRCNMIYTGRSVLHRANDLETFVNPEWIDFDHKLDKYWGIPLELYSVSILEAEYNPI